MNIRLPMRIAAVAMVAASCGAAADPGETLLPVDSLTRAGQIEDLCTAGAPGSAVACNAYLAGMYEGLLEGQLNSPEQAQLFCPPEGGVAQDEIKQLFLDFVADDRQRRSDDASLSLLTALEDQFPCPAAAMPSEPSRLEAGETVA